MTATKTQRISVLRGSVAALALLLAACTAAPDNQQISLALPQPPVQSETQTATQREHARILASYGGAYENERVQTEIERTIDRLVAASERPDLRYKVTILNSPAINAFALPNGQVYITRGLVALANDKAELEKAGREMWARLPADYQWLRDWRNV